MKKSTEDTATKEKSGRMDLDEAISHLKDTLEDKNHDWGCEQCKQEHEQLLDWLIELRESRKIITYIKGVAEGVKLSEAFKKIQYLRKCEEDK